MNDDSTSGSSAPVAIPEAPSKYKSEMKKVCGDRARNRPKKTTQVTHYYIPVLGRQSPHPIKCHNMEGVCKYIYDGEEYIYNYTPYKGKTTWAKISAQLRSEYYAKNGKPNKKKGRKKYTPSFTKYATERHERLRDARCKFGIGYGARDNCTHPCRSLAASRKDHEAGQVLYFPELVGKRCGSGSSAMIHDGFMVITDTGSPKKFNHEGRFDFFWGDCKRYNKSSQCLEGNATKFSRILSGGEYCEAWSPRDPLHNEDLALELTNKIRQEAINRNDYRSAASFSLDQFVRGGNLYAQIYGRPRSTAIANRSTPK